MDRSIRQMYACVSLRAEYSKNVVFGMYIILYIQTNHWLYNTTQIYLYFMLKQFR